MTTSIDLWRELQQTYDGKIPADEMARLRALEATERAEQIIRDTARVSLTEEALRRQR